MLILAIIVIMIELIPLIKKKQSKEAAVLLLLGVITLAYGYYYSTNQHTASLAASIIKLFKLR